jgi:hypothetical protein
MTFAIAMLVLVVVMMVAIGYGVFRFGEWIMDIFFRGPWDRRDK